MTRLLLFVFILSFLTEMTYSQLYQGPATGSVPGGVVVSTNDFSNVSLYIFKARPTRNKKSWKLIPNESPLLTDESPLTSKFIDGVQLQKSLVTSVDSSIVLKSFEGIQMTNSIPPDPYIAVGPNHIMLLVNSTFRICKKNGETLKTIAASDWFETALAGANPFDPKVIYDQFSNRWVMVWLHADDASKTASYLVSVSDDDDPMGTWFNYSFNSSLNGTTDAQTWADYEAVGYDDKAIYITSNQWTFDDLSTKESEYSFKGNKIRAIIKDQLYSNTGGSVEWMDIWSIRHSASSGELIYKLRPARMLSSSNAFYLLARSPYSTGQYVLLYKLSSVFSAPKLTVSNVSVSTYSSPPDANQLGGSGSSLIEISGSDFVSEPLFYNGLLYHTFAIKNTSGNNSALRFISINTSTNKKLEDISIEREGSWYYYPAVAVDKKENVMITFSRSGIDEYPSAYYITKPTGTIQFNNSKAIKTGIGNYVNVGTGTRNRWGDYNGIWNDPNDMNNIWLYTEFSARTNTWGTWVGNVRLAPYNNANILSSDTLLDFGFNQLGKTSKPKQVIFKNIGYETLSISDIKISNNDFKILSSINFPVELATLDSLVLDVVFNPTSANNYLENIEIISNAENNNNYKIYLNGNGYAINPVVKNSLYGLGELNTELLLIDPKSGKGSSLGSTTVKGLVGLSVNPLDGVLYALQDPFYSTDGLSSLSHLNAASGGAYYLFNTDLSLTTSCFDKNGNLYAASKDGALFRIDINTGEYTLIDSLGISVSSIAINPADQQLWLSVGQASTVGKDLIYKVNKDNGDTIFVGRAGTGINIINAMTFSNDGTLYGSIGNNAATLVRIDTKTGLATNIGPIGFKRVKGLAYLPDSLTSVGAGRLVNNLPDKFYLKQNYPNPFNPNTIIEYALPFDSEVKLSIFNIIGQEIKQLINENQSAGIHKIKFNAADIDNVKLTSGIYFYKISVLDKKGNEYKDIKKMILLK